MTARNPIVTTMPRDRRKAGTTTRLASDRQARFNRPSSSAGSEGAGRSQCRSAAAIAKIRTTRHSESAVIRIAPSASRNPPKAAFDTSTSALSKVTASRTVTHHGERVRMAEAAESGEDRSSIERSLYDSRVGCGLQTPAYGPKEHERRRRIQRMDLPVARSLQPVTGGPSQLRILSARSSTAMRRRSSRPNPTSDITPVTGALIMRAVPTISPRTPT